MFIVLNLEMYFMLATKNFMKMKLVNHKYSIRSCRMTFKYDRGGCFLMGSSPRRIYSGFIEWQHTGEHAPGSPGYMCVCLFLPVYQLS